MVNLQDDYDDYSCYFIASLIERRLKFHAEYLLYIWQKSAAALHLYFESVTIKNEAKA